MADVAFASESFLTYAKLYLRDCPNALVAHHLKLAARDFFENTRRWWVDLADINVVGAPPTSVYALASPVANTEIRHLLRVRLNGRYIYPYSEMQLRLKYGDQWMDEESDEAACYIMDDETTIRLVPKPTTSITAGLKIRAALVPALASTGIPDTYFNDYAEIIGYGAVADLSSVDGKPYTSRLNATKYAALYTQKMTEVRIMVNQQYSDNNEVATFQGLLW